MTPSRSRFEPRHQCARSTSHTFRYLASGVREPGVAPLVLIHSAGGDAENDFGFLLPMLSRHRLTLAVELPVLEGSPEPSNILEAYRAAIDAVLDAERIADTAVAVAGVGLGGTVSLNYAARNDRVERVIVIAGWADPSQSMILHAQLIRHLILKDPAAVDDYLLLSLHSDGLLRKTRSARLNRESWDPFHRRLYQQAQLMEKLDVSHQLGDVSMPCLIIGAINDRLVPAASSTDLANALPSGVAAWVATAHAAVAERPAEVLALIDDFLVNGHHYLPGTTLERDRP